MLQSENALHPLTASGRQLRRDQLRGSFELPPKKTPELAQSLVERTDQEIDSSTHLPALVRCLFAQRRKKASDIQCEVSDHPSGEVPEVRLTELSAK